MEHYFLFYQKALKTRKALNNSERRRKITNERKSAKTRAYCQSIADDSRGSCAIAGPNPTTSEGYKRGDDACFVTAKMSLQEENKSETYVCVCSRIVFILERRAQDGLEEHRTSDSEAERETLHFSDAAN